MWRLSKIPKIAHFYWGNDTISYLRYLTVASFTKLNPDWEARVYFPKIKYQGANTWITMEHAVKFTGRDYLLQLKELNLQQIEVDFAALGFDPHLPEPYKADFLRWRLLATVGGLWSDFDIFYFRPLECLDLNREANHDLETVVCLHESEAETYHSIGFLLSSPHNRYYQLICSQSHERLDLLYYQSIGAWIPNILFPSMAAVRERLPGLRVANLGLNAVYPIDYTKIADIFVEKSEPYRFSETSVGLHWFAGSYLAGVCENLLEETVVAKVDNLICRLIRGGGLLGAGIEGVEQ